MCYQAIRVLDAFSKDTDTFLAFLKNDNLKNRLLYFIKNTHLPLPREEVYYAWPLLAKREGLYPDIEKDLYPDIEKDIAASKSLEDIIDTMIRSIEEKEAEEVNRRIYQLT